MTSHPVGPQRPSTADRARSTPVAPMLRRQSGCLRSSSDVRLGLGHARPGVGERPDAGRPRARVPAVVRQREQPEVVLDRVDQRLGGLGDDLVGPAAHHPAAATHGEAGGAVDQRHQRHDTRVGGLVEDDAPHAAAPVGTQPDLGRVDVEDAVAQPGARQGVPAPSSQHGRTVPRDRAARGSGPRARGWRRGR